MAINSAQERSSGLGTSTSATVTMDWITVGNANNAADTTGYGFFAKNGLCQTAC